MTAASLRRLTNQQDRQKRMTMAVEAKEKVLKNAKLLEGDFVAKLDVPYILSSQLTQETEGMKAEPHSRKQEQKLLKYLQ